MKWLIRVKGVNKEKHYLVENRERNKAIRKAEEIFFKEYSEDPILSAWATKITEDLTIIGKKKESKNVKKRE